jgi:tRNA G18 (ribose-2'-O)-methylase SpoU
VPSIIPITAAADPRLNEYAAVSQPELALTRGCFVAEGRLVVERLILERRCRVRSVVVTNTAHRAMAAALAALPEDVPVYLADHALMESMTGFHIHRGCLAIADRPSPQPSAALEWASTLVVLERCGNVDNMGGIFRSAAAFNVDAVVLSPGCCDPLYRKAIRTSMGAALSVPFVPLTVWPQGLADLKAQGFVVVATTPREGTMPIDDAFRYGRPTRLAVLAGAEGDGLSAEALALADVCVRVPTSSRVDSLNIVVALSIVLARLSALPVSDKT